MTIRPAAITDLPAIVDLGKALYEQGPWSRYATFDEASLAASIRLLIDGEGVVLVAEADTCVVGIAVAVLFPLYFNAEVTAAQELFWFVKPGHRNGIGLRLFAALEDEARAAGASIFCAASSSGLRIDTLAHLYTRRGYEPAEHTFMRRL